MNTTIYTFGGIIIFFAVLFSGVHIERQRIYDKCLDSFADMPYTHVRTACKELIK